eukprot:m.97653 g.97653  ORF g.97653 m.97653 type:complete len:54 (+) comp12499_c0_seq5:682-843(+)
MLIEFLPLLLPLPLLMKFIQTVKTTIRRLLNNKHIDTTPCVCVQVLLLHDLLE